MDKIERIPYRISVPSPDPPTTSDVVRQVISQRPRPIKKKRQNNRFDPNRFLVYYDSRVHPLIAEYMARDGCTEVEIATKIGITKQTFDIWKRKHTEFRKALQTSLLATNEQVTKALLSRCLGYEFEERETIYKTFLDPTTKKEIKRLEKEKIVKKQMAPDPQSCFFWLTNKDRQHWQSMGALASAAARDRDNQLNPEQVASLLQASTEAIMSSVIGGETLH